MRGTATSIDIQSTSSIAFGGMLLPHKTPTGPPCEAEYKYLGNSESADSLGDSANGLQSHCPGGQSHLSSASSSIVDSILAFFLGLAGIALAWMWSSLLRRRTSSRYAHACIAIFPAFTDIAAASVAIVAMTRATSWEVAGWVVVVVVVVCARGTGRGVRGWGWGG